MFCLVFVIGQTPSLAADVSKEYADVKKQLMDVCDKIDEVVADNDDLVVDIKNKMAEIAKIERDYVQARIQKQDGAKLKDIAHKYSEAIADLGVLCSLYNLALDEVRQNLLKIPRLDQAKFRPLLDKDRDRTWSDRFLATTVRMNAPLNTSMPRVSKFIEESNKEIEHQKLDPDTATKEEMDAVADIASEKMLEEYFEGQKAKSVRPQPLPRIKR
jgi:predicted nuclease with TOPRIM domain